MADLVPGTVLGNRFEVVGILGYGGMATVYLARDRLREEEVALKVLHDHLARSASMRARLRREVRTAARLSSPHALVAWDLHDLDGHLGLSMPVHRGVTLAERVGQRGPLDGPALERLARELSAALGEAHRLGIVHRDVTPPNVLIDAVGRSVLTDFGLARSATQSTMTSTAVLGTAGYAAPEVYQGVRTDPRSDLYGLGAVLYFAATGAPPFAAPDPMGVLRRQLSGEFVPLATARPDLPPAIASTVDRLLALDPDERPPEAAAVARALDADGPAARLGWGTWAVELEVTDAARPDALAEAFAAAAGRPGPQALRVGPSAPRFTLVAGVDEPTALRLAGAARQAGYEAAVVDVTPETAHRAPLSSILGAASVSAALGAGGGLVLWLFLALVATPVVASLLPPWRSGEVAVTALLIVGGLAAAWLGPVGALAGVVHTVTARRPHEIVGPVFDGWSRDGLVGLAWLLGTAVAAIPGAAVLASLWVLTVAIPPVIVLPPWVPVAGSTLEGFAAGGGALVALIGLAAASFASWATASAWQEHRPPVLAVVPSSAGIGPAAPSGAPLVERVQAEIFALEQAIAQASDRLPLAATADLRATLRALSREVAPLGPRLAGLQHALRGLDETGNAAEAERLEIRIARARTLARAGDEPADLAALDRALAAHLDALAQADVVEDELTALTARLLELLALATRARVDLLTDDGTAERAIDLARRLGVEVSAARSAVAETGDVATAEVAVAAWRIPSRDPTGA